MHGARRHVHGSARIRHVQASETNLSIKRLVILCGPEPYPCARAADAPLPPPPPLRPVARLFATPPLRHVARLQSPSIKKTVPSYQKKDSLSFAGDIKG